MVRAKFISTEGSYLEAVIEVSGQNYHVMDEFSVNEETSPKVGDEFDFDMTAELLDIEEWEDIFNGNPEGKIGLEQIEGWRYRAFGKVVSVNPVLVDCGLIQVEGLVNSSDPKLIGESVAFTVSRLGGYAYAT